MDKTRAAATHSLKELTLASSTFATIYSVFNCSHFNFLTVEFALNSDRFNNWPSAHKHSPPPRACSSEHPV
ncbi:hypothetical protein D5086_020904 [Populus alba]|uniref:Uncharacterized protein n=1 Tax=Populus alba TaxID=43335 RepID=A0ACC4BM15_POPAL